MNLSTLTKLDAADPLPALGAKVEKPRKQTPAEVRADELAVFEEVDYGFWHGISEAECRQVKVTRWPFPVAQDVRLQDAFSILGAAVRHELVGYY